MTKKNSFPDLLEHFGDITRKSGGWHTVDAIVKMLDKADFWTNDTVATAEQNFKKSFVRKMIRKIKDDNDWPEWASIEIERDGQKVRVYKQETLFNLSDYKQVVRYHKARGSYHARMANGYVRRARERLGTQMRLPFPGIQ